MKAATVAMLASMAVTNVLGSEPTQGPALPPGCVATSNNFDRLEIACDAAMHSRTEPWKLQVDFTGGHDDTSAWIEVTADGVGVDCAPGGKARSDGDFGDIRLACSVDAAGARARATARLEFLVRWRHAEYVAHRLWR